MLTRILLALLLVPNIVLASCEQFEAEAEAFSGIVPRLDANGRISAYIMYGEAAFLSPKRSLIINARRKAELSAKQAFTEFLESNFSADTLTQDLVNQIEVTDGSGNTAGLAEEISTSLNVMRSNSSATLSGIVKLDECVDTEGKYVMVALGWKPQTSQAAHSVRNGGAEDSQNHSPNAETVVAVAVAATSEAVGGSTSGSGKVEIITVTTQGVGVSLKSATNEALRMAVSQVYGEAFASQNVSIETVAELEVTASDGQSAGVAMEQSVSQQAVSSSTSGIIRSWRYLEKTEDGSGYSVSVEVNIPQYQSLMDPNKLKVIISQPSVKPTVGRGSVVSEFADTLHRRLEQSIAQTNRLTVLERQYTGAIGSELQRIGLSGNTSEMAKLGQQVGADLIVIPIIERFSSRMESRQVGQTLMEREVFDVEVSVKVAEVATSNLVATRSFPLNNRRLKPENSVQMVLNLVMEPINGFIGSDLGGGFNPNFQASGVAQPDIAELSREAKSKIDEVKKNAETDW